MSVKIENIGICPNYLAGMNTFNWWIQTAST